MALEQDVKSYFFENDPHYGHVFKALRERAESIKTVDDVVFIQEEIKELELPYFNVFFKKYKYPMPFITKMHFRLLLNFIQHHIAVLMRDEGSPNLKFALTSLSNKITLFRNNK